MKANPITLKRIRFSKKRFEAAKKFANNYTDGSLVSASDPDLNNPETLSPFTDINEQVDGQTENKQLF